jgi:polyisoprenoid-binding protein YceI
MTEAQAQPATGALPLASGRWTVDPVHSAVVFSVRHLGLSKVRGRFDRFEATLDVGDSLDDVKVDATIDMTSVDTNNPDRDAHLRTTDFFNVEQHPTMRFQTTKVSGSDADWQLEGHLTINGVTQPIALDVEFNGTEPFQEDLHAGFTAAGELKRSEFGIDFGIIPLSMDKLALADTVKFELDLQFVEPKS